MTARRNERLELRLTVEERELLTRAAELNGEDLATLLRRTALTEARRVLKSDKE